MYMFFSLREKVLSPEVAHYGYVLDGLPTVEDDVMSAAEQIELIKNMKLNPDFIINIKVFVLPIIIIYLNKTITM